METGQEYPNAYRYRRIVQAKRYIDRNFDDDIDLDDISGEAHFSKYHFLRLFKRAYGMTPNRYLTQRRLSEARRLLEEDRLSISKICLEVGFESLGSFSSLFKRRMGISPSRYRIRSRRKSERIENIPGSVVPGCFVRAFYGNSNFREANDSSEL